MDIDEQNHQKFLEELLEWCKKQDHILDKIEDKLYEMKEIAECALANDVTPDEIASLNRQLDNLKKEIQSLEKQLNPVVH